MRLLPLIFALILATGATTEGSAAVVAFPGAAGGGALSVGGRGGVIYEVTSLADSGPGTLRAGLALSTPRIIVFCLGGTIELLSSLEIDNPYVTIAGQTAPGGGIQLSGRNTSATMLWINTHDVVVRYLRLRHGYNAGSTQTGSPIAVEGTYNCIFDHNTLMWTMDENISTWGATVGGAPRNLTWSWNLVAEPLSGHPTSFITGSDSNAVSNAMTDIDGHHNVIANSSHRNPLIKNKSFRFVSNLVYNWSYYGTMVGQGVQADIISNYYKPGPLNALTSSGSFTHRYEVEVYPASTYANQASGSPSLYIVGNRGPNNADPANDNWPMVREVTDENGSLVGPLSTTYRRSLPLSALAVPIVAHPAGELEAVLLPTVGASCRLSADGTWVTNRDSTDQRVISEIQNGLGIVPVTEADVGGFPVINSGTPYPDTDHDGMSDSWETARGLNPSNPADGPADRDADGYTNVEEFLNGAVANQAPVISAMTVVSASLSAALSVTASDDADRADLTYTWSATGPAAVTFTTNGTNAAKAGTATFAEAGAYVVTVTVRDAGGLTATGTEAVVIASMSGGDASGSGSSSGGGSSGGSSGGCGVGVMGALLACASLLGVGYWRTKSQSGNGERARS